MDRLRRRDLPLRDVSSRVRLTKTPAEYLVVRESRRELPYEEVLASGRTSWSVGDRVRVYRKRNGCDLLDEWDDGPVGDTIVEAWGYDVDHYVSQLRQTFASRRALRVYPTDYETVFADPDQLSLSLPAVTTIRTVLAKKAEANHESF